MSQYLITVFSIHTREEIKADAVDHTENRNSICAQNNLRIIKGTNQRKACFRKAVCILQSKARKCYALWMFLSKFLFMSESV